MGKKLVMYLINDSNYGPKTIDIGNWSGRGIYSPVSHLENMLETRDEYKRPGVYFLKVPSNNSNYNEKIYIGEGEDVSARLKKHLVDSNKEFDECIVFIGKDEMLTKAHIKYLETKLIQLSLEYGNVEVENIQQSNKLTSLPEADQSDMDYFLEQIKIILPTVEFNCFRPNTISINKIKNKDLVQNKNEVYYIRNKGIKATLIINDEGYVVKKGSECIKENVNSLAVDRVRYKNKLIDLNILKKHNNILIFDKDTIFKSSSQAASIILGAQVSGTQIWKDKFGATYKENIEKKLGE
jgi:Domain of unknown function (DUF4357)